MAFILHLLISIILNHIINLKQYLIFGLLRPYKNLEQVMHLFATKKSLMLHKLIVAGMFFSENYKQFILQRFSKAPNIDIIPYYLPENKLADLVSRVDFSILSFANALTSGSLLYTISHELPSIVP